MGTMVQKEIQYQNQTRITSLETIKQMQINEWAIKINTINILARKAAKN